VKTGWPNNQIIQPPPGNTTSTAARGQQVGEGDHSVVVAEASTWMYLFFVEWDVEPGSPIRVGLARSSVAAGGIPGTWKKFYCDGSATCGLATDGIGGESSALANITGTAVTWRGTFESGGGGEYIAIGSWGGWQE